MENNAETFPIYFRDTTVPRGRVKRLIKERRLVGIARGVYMGLPAPEDPVRRDPERLAAAINATLRRYALRITAHLFPNPMVAYASAYRQGPSESGLITLIGRRAASVEVGADLDDQFEEEVGKIRPLRIERRRTRAAELMRPAVDFVSMAPGDGLESESAAMRYCPSLPDGVAGLKAQQVRITTPARTVLDICTVHEEEGYALSEGEFQALLQLAGLPHFGEDAAKRIHKAVGQLRARYPEFPGSTFNYLDGRLKSLAGAENLEPQAAYSRRAALEEFSLRWHGTPLGSLIHRREGQWVFHYEKGWLLPIWPEETNQRFPAFLHNLFPEYHPIPPHEWADFLREHPRLMSNLTVVEVEQFGRRYPEDRLQYHLSEVAEDPHVYSGAVRGLPDYDVYFARRVDSIAARGELTQMSGGQAKLPMYMGRDYIRPAVDASFTHLLKIPRDPALANAEVMEWFAMTLAREAGVDTADVRLVDIGAIEPGDIDPRLRDETDQAGVQREPIEQARELNEKMKDGAVTDALNAGVFQEVVRLTDTAQAGGSARALAGQAPLGLLVERFDIPTPQDPRWRLGEDFCSLSNRPSVHHSVKYEGSMEEVASLLKERSTQWDKDRYQLFRQVVANNLVCNSDAHLKNYSLLRIASYDASRWDQVRLAPAYDVCTATVTLRGSRPTQALPIAGKRNGPNDPIAREDVVAFAIERCDIEREEAERILDEMIASVRHSAEALARTPPQLIARNPALAGDVQQAERHVLAACARLERPRARPALAGPGMAP